MIQTGLAWNAAMATSGLKLIQEVVNDQLACLKNLLDRYNGYVRPLAYYDVLAGDWLFHFTHQVYVAWKEVQAGNIPANAQPIPIASQLAQYGELQIQGKLHEYLRWAVASLLNGNSPETWVFEAETALITSGGRKQPQDYFAQPSDRKAEYLDHQSICEMLSPRMAQCALALAPQVCMGQHSISDQDCCRRGCRMAPTKGN